MLSYSWLLVLLLLSVISSTKTFAAIDFDPTLATTAAIQTVESVKVVFTTICRNEAVNFRANLHLWLPVIQYYIFMMDDRNSDDSESVIHSTLRGRALGYKILPHKFDGFGQARTASLTAAWRYFPQATHVLIADPDWRPKPGTLGKTHLVYNAQVYRFVVYDRNGVTFRNVDWLLRHKEGLRMRYSLHEVVDVDGDIYAVVNIPWQAEEIELPGTWHDKVGHGHSRSMKRFDFDLSMLYKDIPVYGGIDPHLNYYLAVTHDAMSSSVAGDLYNRTNGVSSCSAEVEYHRKMALGNCTLRAVEPYPLEFLEQRWGTQLIIGSTYALTDTIFHDHVKGIRWYSMCRDFGPGQTECQQTLARYVYNLGDFAAAVAYAYDLIRINPTKRIMQNTRYEKECNVPYLASAILAESLYRDVVQRLNAQTPLTGLSTLGKYINHLRAMASRPICTEGDAVVTMTVQERAPAPHTVEAINRALEADNTLPHASMEAACEDLVFQQYIASNKIHAYNCKALKQLIANTHKCVDFNTNLPPPSEDLHVNVYGEYIGAASLLDIAHHAYMGDTMRFTKISRVYRVLFAEYFNPRILYNLIGFASRRLKSRLSIIVVRESESDVKMMKETIGLCGASINDVQFITSPLHVYLASLQTRPDVQFDYVEYNAGINISPAYLQDLALMHQALATDGIIGMTYFTANHHQETLMKLISKQIIVAHLPFSVRPEYLMKQYLEHHGLSSLKNDKALFAFFGGTLDRNMYDIEPVKADVLKSRRVYNQSGFEHLLNSTHFKAVSWVPSAFARPFEELDHYEVVKFQSAGLSQESYVESIMPMFRYTVYVAKADSMVPGRARVESIIERVDLREITILDRYETLGATFADSATKARSGSTTTLHFTYYGIPSLRLAYYVNHKLLPGLNALSSSPKMASVLRENDAFWAIRENAQAITKGEDIERVANRTLYKLQVCQVFAILEKMNAISFTHEGAARRPAENFASVKHEGEIIAENIRRIDIREDIVAARLAKSRRTTSGGPPAVQEASKPEQPAPKLASAVVGSEGEAALREEIASLMDLLSSKPTAEPSSAAHAAPVGNIPEATTPKPKPQTDTKKQPKPASEKQQKSKTPKQQPRSPRKAQQGSSSASPRASRPASERVSRSRVKKNPVAEVLARVTSVQLPSRQMRGDIERSSRSLSCIDNKNSLFCYKRPSGRRTASLDTACSKKFTFDIKQLEYIAATNASKATHIRLEVLPRISHTREIFSEHHVQLVKNSMYKPPSCVLLQTLKGCQPQKKSCKCNYFYYISDEPAMLADRETSFIHDAALEQMHIAHEHMAQNDFAVVDVILKSHVLSQLSHAALTSTIWHDATNGNAVAAHHDDGLVHDAFARLAAEIAAGLSMLKVIKYYVLAQDLLLVHEGPLSRVESNQLAVILWLNPVTLPDDPESPHDGLQIFVQKVNDILVGQGINVAKDIHPDFMSQHLGLEFDLEVEPWKEQSLQQIGRASNRLVLVGPRLPFRFAVSEASKEITQGFAEATSVAFVVVLQLS